MQQNVRVNVTNQSCCGVIVGGVLLIVVISIFAGALGRLFDFATSLPGLLLIGLLAIAAAIYFTRRRPA